MKGIILLSLFGVGAAAIWKHHVASSASRMVPVNDGLASSGVSVYPARPAPQLAQQVQAATITNEDAVSDVGYSAAFGPYENQPGDGEDSI